MVEKGFELSEASHAPVMLELRIRACHVTGAFAAKDNVKAERLRRQPHADAGAASTTRGSRIRRSPSRRRSCKVEERLPAARDFIRANKLNELIAGDLRRHRHHRAWAA